MTKQQFSEIFLSRFILLSDENKFSILDCLFLAPGEIDRERRDPDERIEDAQAFKEWAQNISELLFPEQLGELIEGPLGEYRDT